MTSVTSEMPATARVTGHPDGDLHSDQFAAAEVQVPAAGLHGAAGQVAWQQHAS